MKSLTTDLENNGQTNIADEVAKDALDALEEKIKVIPYDRGRAQLVTPLIQ